MVCVGSQAITGATFSHWAAIAQKSESPSKHHPSVGEVIKEVMGFLISSDWVLGEATDLNIHVSEGEVRHTFDHIRNQQFPKKKEFKAWLKQSGQTVADLLFRVRLISTCCSPSGSSGCAAELPPARPRASMIEVGRRSSAPRLPHPVSADESAVCLSSSWWPGAPIRGLDLEGGLGCSWHSARWPAR